VGKKFPILQTFKSNKDGATLVYVAMMLGLLFAAVGLAIDFSRLYIADTQAQAAADAAAIAAASQLDGTTDSITRATNAAMTTPLVANQQRFADEANAGADVNIVAIRFLTGLPADDDTPIGTALETIDPFDAEFVEVTTEVLTHNNFFLPAIGIADTRNLQARSVAGQDSVICRVTPLAICNPNEQTHGSGANFEVGDWRGRQIIVHETGAGASWAPGNFGFLNVPGLGNGASALADTLASIDGANTCFSTRLDTQPGAINSLRSALNVRFDIYDNPFFKNESGNPEFAPAANVTKGRIWTGSGASLCNSFDEPGPPTAMGFPRDNVFGAPDNRFGNGYWDCLDYWTVNHPTDPIPAGCTNNTNTISRYDIYRHEIANNIPGPGTTGSTEEGAPVCYTGGPVVDDPAHDRRLVNFAVMNCLEHNVHGNSTDVPSEAFVRAFITEPVGDESTPGASDFDLFLEIVDVVAPGTNAGPLHETVEIFR